MPRLTFVRTPTLAEGGPDHNFVGGGTYEVSARSYRRWVDIGVAIPAAKEQIIQPTEMDLVKIKASESAVKEVFKPVESGGQAPPIMVRAASKTLRSAGGGMWNVYDGVKRLNPAPLSRKDAEALAAE